MKFEELQVERKNKVLKSWYNHMPRTPKLNDSERLGFEILKQNIMGGSDD